MNSHGVFTIRLLSGFVGTCLLYAGDLSSYRGFQFGMSVAAAAKQAGMNPEEVRSVHQRPALIQELDWQRYSFARTDPDKADPVKGGLLYFYNGELFRMVITYDRYKVEGLTAEDMIEAISQNYGPATKPKVDISYHSNYGDSAPVLARWQDSLYSYNLIQNGDRSSFVMILYSKRLATLAETAIAKAVGLDMQEAPQRQIELERAKEAESRLLLEKARIVNKPNFRP